MPENQCQFSAPHNVVHSDWLSTLKYSAVDGKGISPDNSRKLANTIVMGDIDSCIVTVGKIVCLNT